MRHSPGHSLETICKLSSTALEDPFSLSLMILDLVFPFDVAFYLGKWENPFAENYGFSNTKKKLHQKKNIRHKKRNQLQERERERKQANLGFIAFVFLPLPRPWRRMEVFVVH